MRERVGLETAARELDGEIRSEEAPDPLPLSYVQRWCERYERLIRRQYPPGGQLSAEAERRLAALDPSTMTGALQRWAYLKHLYLVRSEGLARREESRQTIEEAARQLLRREPVRVRLGGRVVEVTGRSYAALYEIAACDAQIRALEADLDVCSRLAAAAEAELAASPGWRRAAALRRRIRTLHRIHVRICRELREQRRWLYAHALTPSGAPARSAEDVPEWVEEIGRVEDALLLAAVIEAGHGRLARLGEPPPSKSERSNPPAEDFGWATLFASIERQQKLPPGTLYDVDLFQLRTWLRAGAPPPLELED